MYNDFYGLTFNPFSKGISEKDSFHSSDFQEMTHRLDYLKEIRYVCIVMSENYINSKFEDIKNYANVIEARLFDDLSKDDLISENKANLKMCKKHSLNYVLIDERYNINIDF